MKITRLLLPLLCCMALVGFAQNKNNPNPSVVLDKTNRQDCGTPLPSLKLIQEQAKLIKQLAPKGINASPNLFIPLKIHIVRQSNGTGGLPTSTLETAIANLNTTYASMNMNFFMCSSIHYIDNDELYQLDVEKENTRLVLNNVNDAINIYFVGSLTTNGTAINGISSFPGANALDNRMILSNDVAGNGITLSHEMGHYWNLYHTYETFYGAELVNGSNCNSAGDFICDTPADPCGGFALNCQYTGTTRDANGQLYSPMVNNLMSCYGVCRNSFTAGQYARMTDGYALRNLYMNANTYTLACSATTALAPDNLNLSVTGCKINISWADNATNEMGYIIEMATSMAGPFMAIGRTTANATSFSDDAFHTDGGTYYYRVVAANSNAAYSVVSSIVFNPVNGACYCIPNTLTCSDGDAISNVTIRQGSTVLLSQNSACTVSGYSLTNTPETILQKGNTYSFGITIPATTYQDGAIAWVDFNKNGNFESNEVVFSKAKAVWTDASATFTVPAGAMAGQTRMRVSVMYNSDPTDPCASPVEAMGYGEIEDYIITIAEAVCDPPLALDVSRCGQGVATLNASGCVGTTNWYATATSETAIATGASYTTPVLTNDAVYYVSCQSDFCTSTRTAIQVKLHINLSFAGVAQLAGSYRVSQSITSTADVTSGTSYYAGKAIMLEAGFQAGPNEVFLASIEGCP